MKRDLMKAVVLVISIVGIFTYYEIFRELSMASAVAEINGEEVTLMYVEMIVTGLVMFGYVVVASYFVSEAIVDLVYGNRYYDD